MNLTSKEQYLAQKGITVKTRGRVRNIPGDKKLGSLERLLIILLLIFVMAIPLDLLLDQDIMTYVGLINYLIIGLAITVKPVLVIDIMWRNNTRFDEIYGEKITKLQWVIRAFGLLLIGIGVVIYYFLVLQ
jgi:hypothetical protein